VRDVDGGEESGAPRITVDGLALDVKSRGPSRSGLDSRNLYARSLASSPSLPHHHHHCHLDHPHNYGGVISRSSSLLRPVVVLVILVVLILLIFSNLLILIITIIVVVVVVVVVTANINLLALTNHHLQAPSAITSLDTLRARL
jgi:hypothetical protein